MKTTKMGSENVWCQLFVAVVFILQFFGTVIGDPVSLPQWKRQLMHFRRWNGSYEYSGKMYACQLVVHSVQYDDNEGAFVTFKSQRFAIDMDAYSDDNGKVVFRKQTQDFHHPHFPAYDDLEFKVELIRAGRSEYYTFVGNIIKPQNSTYGSIQFSPEGKQTSPRNKMESSHLSIGLAIGISLFMLVVCTVVGIVILRWAIRKGYLRHVAMSYKSFRNPRDTPVSFDGQQPDQQAEANVHI